MSELKQTKLAVIVMAVITLLSLVLMQVDRLANIQWKLFILFVIALALTLLLAIKYIAEYAKEKKLW